LGQKGDQLRENEDNCSLADVIKVINIVVGAARLGKIRLAFKI
jgi:hypothetical protein